MASGLLIVGLLLSSHKGLLNKCIKDFDDDCVELYQDTDLSKEGAILLIIFCTYIMMHMYPKLILDIIHDIYYWDEIDHSDEDSEH